jgi:hypothetical protein
MVALLMKQVPPPGSNTPPPPPPPNQISTPATIKLPTLQISDFHGDKLEWVPFWQSFESAVHINPTLSDVQKLNYLRGYLKGEAAESIKGFSMINGNYPEVIKQLQEDYGDKESLIDAHLQKLDNLPTVKKPTDVAALKQLHRHVVSNTKSLDALGTPVSTYGGLLGRRILNSLPAETQRKWTDDKANKSTDFDNILKFLSEQIAAKERYAQLRNGGKQKHKHHRPTR